MTWESGKQPAGHGPPETESRAENGEDESEENRPGLAQLLLYFSCLEDNNESFSSAKLEAFTCSVSRVSLLNDIIQ